MKEFLLLMLLIVPSMVLSETSTCYGTTANGRLENGVQLPVDGNNFVGYSWLARIMGRTYVHSAVKDIVISAYQRLEAEQPGKVFKYAESGFYKGGEFKPHKTHRNGLSVDFIVPVLNAQGQSVLFPTHYFNKFGYDIEFDDVGVYDQFRIDYEAMAAHIVMLHKEAVKHGYDLWRIIFDPKLQSYLHKTKYSVYLNESISFSEKRSWVRHDQHYHVDFSIPCEP